MRYKLIYEGVNEMGNYPVKEYVLYRNPHGQILIDWNETLWEFGHPSSPKSTCVELERGMCEGGPNLIMVAGMMRKKYREGQG